MKAAALISTGNSATPQVVMIFPSAKVLRKVSLSLCTVAVFWERTAVDMRTSYVERPRLILPRQRKRPPKGPQSQVRIDERYFWIGEIVFNKHPLVCGEALVTLVVCRLAALSC